MIIQASTPDEYFAQADEREPELRKLDELIRSEAPDLKRFMLEMMTYNMVGYGPLHYKYASGKEGDTALLSLAAQKNYISLYVLCVSGQKYLAEEYADDLGKASVGKSCVRFKKVSDLNTDTLREMIREATERYKTNKTGFTA